MSNKVHCNKSISSLVLQLELYFFIYSITAMFILQFIRTIDLITTRIFQSFSLFSTSQYILLNDTDFEICCSHVSGVTLLGIPAEIYQHGTQYCSIAVANIAVLLINNYLFMPVFFELQLTSLYEVTQLSVLLNTRAVVVQLIVF